MRITKDMIIFEIMRSHPDAINVFKSYEMSCGGCLAVMDESLEKGARRHGADLENLLNDLNLLFCTNSRGESNDNK